MRTCFLRAYVCGSLRAVLCQDTGIPYGICVCGYALLLARTHPLCHSLFLSLCCPLSLSPPATHCNTLQHTTTHCNTLQHTTTHCNTLRHTATHYNTLLQQVIPQIAARDRASLLMSLLSSRPVHPLSSQNRQPNARNQVVVDTKEHVRNTQEHARYTRFESRPTSEVTSEPQSPSSGSYAHTSLEAFARVLRCVFFGMRVCVCSCACVCE